MLISNINEDLNNNSNNSNNNNNIGNGNNNINNENMSNANVQSKKNDFYYFLNKFPKTIILLL